MQAKKYKISINFGSSSAKKSQRPQKLSTKVKTLNQNISKITCFGFSSVFFGFFNWLKPLEWSKREG